MTNVLIASRFGSKRLLDALNVNVKSTVCFLLPALSGEVKQFIAVSTVKMFIEPSASTTIARLTHSPCTAMLAATADVTQLSTMNKCNVD